MRTGRLDRRIVIRSVQGATNKFGERVGVKTNIAQVWANIDRRGGSEPAKSEQDYPLRKVIFTIRYRDDVGPDDEVRWDGKDYEIQTVEETHYTRKRFMKLHTVLKGVQDG